jgi:hypothetical protein
MDILQRAQTNRAFANLLHGAKAQIQDAVGTSSTLPTRLIDRLHRASHAAESLGEELALCVESNESIVRGGQPLTEIADQSKRGK